MRKVLVGLVALALIAALPAFAAAPKAKMSTPSVACAGSGDTNIFINFTAGSTTGAPAGFSLQWMTVNDFNNLYGGAWPANSDTAPGLCKASFSGNASGYAYNVPAGQSITVEVGDFLFDNGGSTNCAQPLACGTSYVFRAFSHADNTRQRSDFTATVTCSTLPCEPTGGCTLTQGYWKNHNPLQNPFQQDGVTPNPLYVQWPVDSLTLGSNTYTIEQLLSILNTPASGNGLLSLAHQLIAAKLNVANGADPTAVQDAMDQADAMIGGLAIPPTGTGFLKPGVTSTLTGTLDSYNNGLIGPGHCQ